MRIVRRFYEELWNEWDLAVADELVADDVRFRGTLGTELTGREVFKGYVADTRAAFSDWHNRIDELIDAGGVVVARITCSGTHTGELWGTPATGRRVSYPAVGIFRLRDGVIQQAFVVGDTKELVRAISP